MPIKIESHPSATGIFTITNPNSSTPRGITLPDESTTLVGTDATQTLTNKTLAAPVITSYQGGVLSLGTATTLSGTAVQYAIPSWAKRITLLILGASGSGTSPFIIQFGTGPTPTYTTSGYVGSVTNPGGGGQTTYSSGFQISSSVVATDVHIGSVVLTAFGNNTWIQSHSVSQTNNLHDGAGSIALADIATYVRLTTINGTDTFDAGSINIMYEG